MRAKIISAAAGIVAALWLGPKTAPAGAAVIPYTQIDQSRHIEVNVSARPGLAFPEVTDGADESSTATGSFFRSMAYQVTAQEPPPGFRGAAADGSAQQEVVFGDTAIFGTVSASAHASHSGGLSSALADSQFSTHFTVAQDTPFSLSGLITLSSSGLGAVGRFSEIFLLTGQGPQPGESESFVMIGISGGIGGGTYPLQASGVFRPGWTYFLDVQLMGEKSTDGGAGSFKLVDGSADFVLTVPEPEALAAVFVVGPALLARRQVRRYSSVGVRKK